MKPRSRKPLAVLQLQVEIISVVAAILVVGLMPRHPHWINVLRVGLGVLLVVGGMVAAHLIERTRLAAGSTRSENLPPR